MNRFIPLFTVIVLLFSLGACHNPNVEIIETTVPKETIPEGIVVDPENHSIYLSSIHLDNVFRMNREGKSPTELIGIDKYGYSAGVGMELSDNSLFALGSINREKKSVLLEINKENGEINRTYTLPESVPNFMNDLALDDEKNAYITDTEFHRIYKLDYQVGSITIFYENPQIQYPNGIAISENQTKLFIDSYTHGIRIFDLDKHEIINPPHVPTTQIGIDGLKYHKGFLYAVINGDRDNADHRVMRYQLSNNETEIVSGDTLIIGHTTFDIPTTLSIAGNFLYVLANSQLDNLDQEQNKIKDRNKLTPTYVLKMKISNH